MSTLDDAIQKDVKFLMDYHSPRIYPVMAWFVAVNHDSVRLYDPIGRLAFDATEGEPMKYPHCQQEIANLFLAEAVKKASS